MNILQEIRAIREKIKCIEYGIKIIHIGPNLPKSALHNTLQVTQSGQHYLVDRVGVMILLNPAGTGGGPSLITGGIITSLPTVGYNAGSNISIEDWINNVFYDSQVPLLTLTGGGIFEFTSALTVTRTLSWSATRQGATQALANIIVATVDQPFLPPPLGGTVSGTYDVTVNTNVTSGYNAIVITADGKNATAVTVFSYSSKYYIGYTVSDTPIDADIISAVGNNVGGTFASNYNASGVLSIPPVESYVMFAFPASFGVPTIKLNGLAVVFNLITRAFTNASGYTVLYNILISPFPTNSDVEYEVL